VEAACSLPILLPMQSFRPPLLEGVTKYVISHLERDSSVVNMSMVFLFQNMN